MLEHTIFFNFETVSITVKKRGHATTFVRVLVRVRWSVVIIAVGNSCFTFTNGDQDKIIARSFPSWRYQDFLGTPTVLLKDKILLLKLRQIKHHQPQTQQSKLLASNPFPPLRLWSLDDSNFLRFSHWQQLIEDTRNYSHILWYCRFRPSLVSKKLLVSIAHLFITW